jgi:magnesium-transporting ATPase (P-type)
MFPRSLIQAAYDNFAENGRRVIGFISTQFTASGDSKFEPDGDNYPMEGLTFLGMCAIMDPPR